MTDITLEIIRAVVAFLILMAFLHRGNSEEIRKADGWRCLVFGFVLVLFGSVIDIFDNFPSLGKYIIIGETEVQAFLEKVIGYLLGLTLIAIGISRWLPKISEHQKLIQENLKRVEKENKVLRGIVPICMHCNNIRDDQGTWDKLDVYIEKRSEAKFSHCICDKCLEKHYPDELVAEIKRSMGKN